MQEAPHVTLLQPPLVIFSMAVDVCPYGLPAHTGGGSQDALAVLLVVKVGGAHISVLSGLEKATGKNNPPPQPPPQATCVRSLSVLAGRRASGEAAEGPGAVGGDQAVELAQCILSVFKPLALQGLGTPESEAG